MRTPETETLEQLYQEAVVYVRPGGKYILREIYATNICWKRMEKVELHLFANLPVYIGLPDHRGSTCDRLGMALGGLGTSTLVIGRDGSFSNHNGKLSIE